MAPFSRGDGVGAIRGRPTPGPPLLLMRWGLLACCSCGASRFAVGSEVEPIPDKAGVEIHLTKQERGILKKVECDLCKAVLREMHVEVSKHKMVQKGTGSESHVWETSNAICLAMLQKYRINTTVPSLDRKAADEDDEEVMVKSGADPESFMRAMLVLKMGCQQWVEDYGSDTSGFIYKAVRDGKSNPDGVAQDFCTRSIHLCGKGKAQKQKEAKEKEKERMKKRAQLLKEAEKQEAKSRKEDPLGAIPEDSKLGLQRMLEMARDDPLEYMGEDAKKRVAQARGELRCEVCRVVLEDVQEQVLKRPKTMRSETDILPIVEAACSGGKDRSVPAYFGVEPPPLPPLWTDRYRPVLKKKTQRWVLRAFPKEKAKSRHKWRKLSAKGKQKPPGEKETEEDMMMTLACKDVLDAARMTEALYAEQTACGEPCERDLALATALKVCKTAEDAACEYKGHAKQEQEL